MCKYYIMYNVPSMKQTNVYVGPYNKDEIPYHKNDISTFEDVEDVRVLSENDLRNFLYDESYIIVNDIGFTD
jgi:hypothetical protein